MNRTKQKRPSKWRIVVLSSHSKYIAERTVVATRTDVKQVAYDLMREVAAKTGRKRLQANWSLV